MPTPSRQTWTNLTRKNQLQLMRTPRLKRPSMPSLFLLLLLALLRVHSTGAFMVRAPSRPSFWISSSAMLEHSSNSNTNSNSNTSPIEMEMEKLTTQCRPGKNVVHVASQVEDLFYSQNIKSTHSLNTLLKAWQRTTAVLADGTQAQAALNETFTTVTRPIYTARDAAEHATKILLTSDTTLQEATSYNVVIDAWAKSNDKDAPHTAERLLKKLLDHETLSPDAYSYSGILDAWAHSKDPDAIQRLHQIYKHMVSANLVNSIRTFNSVLTTYAKQMSKIQNKTEMMLMANEAHDFLQQEKARFANLQDPEQQPDAFTYSIMIDICGRCGVVKSTLQAESLLTELKELSALQPHLDKLKPNVRTYTSLISAWSKTKSDKAAVRGEELLQEMLQGPSPEMKPNQRTYAALCTCWARSQDPNKATRVLTLLRTMKQQYADSGNAECQPTLSVYNAAIDACSRCGGDAKQQTAALKIAFAINKAMLMDGIQPDSMTFDRLMQATAYLMPNGEERNGVARALLDKAKTAGCVSFDVVKNFRKAVDNNVVHEQLKEMEDAFGQIDYYNIPKAWCKNWKN